MEKISTCKSFLPSSFKTETESSNIERSFDFAFTFTLKLIKYFKSFVKNKNSEAKIQFHRSWNLQNECLFKFKINEYAYEDWIINKFH